MRSAGAALLLLALASGAWGFVPAARLAPARAVAARQRAAGALRMDAGEGAAPKLAKIEAIKVCFYLSDVVGWGWGRRRRRRGGGRQCRVCVHVWKLDGLWGTRGWGQG